jgi:tryptophanyl-tRNA synthetase
MLFERIDRELAPMRERYEHLVAHPSELEDILQAGAAKARRETLPLIRELRSAVGLRSLAQAPVAAKAKAARQALPQFKQYREADGRFYFKLVAADGQLLLQSLGFDAPKEAGQAIGRLQKEGEAALAALQPLLQPADAGQVLAALQQLRDAAE